MAEATMRQVIQALDKIGWDKGIAELEKIVLRTEWLQAELYGDPATVKQAQRLSRTIIKQSQTIAKLKQLQRERAQKK